MLAALVTVELHVPGASSLKERRGPVRSLVRRLRNDLDVSVAELGDQDLWQRATLGVAIAASSEVGARKVAQSVEKICAGDPRVEVIGFSVEIVQTES
ncbi:DUF503 domain-containing protein [Egibacter rhizosphaerae]|uniref:DUF503 domain-containing protein n=1 Tax=Egibacter rhizosphaerae TaxID=1670831 RepID=A0A411YCP6_9ACTN|nr:DUF503 domain-containing protein [Egibacter rhizosphaerae]QBI18945.1 DUF503 domain-containing protein [Egibacter rhizosphaerae]